MENFREFALNDETCLSKHVMNEMPIQIQKVGGWGDKARPYGYKKDDIGIMNRERGIEKITRKWSKVKQNFNTYICRSSQCFKHIEVGEVNEDFVRNQLGLKIVPNPTKPDEIKIDPNSINYIITNNRGAERVMLNYWTLAHRFGHAISAGRGHTGAATNNTYEYFEREFWADMRRIIEGAYGVKISFNGRFVEGRNGRTIMKKVLEAMGTMGSARKAQLREYFEFPHEILAQYIIEQRVKFNNLPRSIKYFKMPEEGSYRSGGYGGYGSYEPTQTRGFQSSVDSKDELDLESWNEYIQEGFTDATAYNLEQVLESCVGKIYVM